MVHSEIKHKSKTTLVEWSETSACTCSLLCFCIKKRPLHATSTQRTVQSTLYITRYLLNVNKICDILRRAWMTTEWVIHGILPLNLSSILLQNSGWKFPPHSFKIKGRWWSWWGLKLYLAVTKLGKPYWKHHPLIEKIFMTHLRLKFLLTVIWSLQSGFFLKL